MINKKVKRLILIGTIFSIIGFFYSRYNQRINKKKLNSAEILYAHKNDSVDFSILAIKDKRNAKHYLKAIRSQAKTVNFNYILINEGEKLYLLEVLPDGLYKVGLKTNYRSAVRPPYLECYIWMGFLTENF